MSEKKQNCALLPSSRLASLSPHDIGVEIWEIIIAERRKYHRGRHRNAAAAASHRTFIIIKVGREKNKTGQHVRDLWMASSTFILLLCSLNAQQNGKIHSFLLIEIYFKLINGINLNLILIITLATDFNEASPEHPQDSLLLVNLA